MVKAFVDESGRDEFLQILAGARTVTTSRLSYVETRAAFARAAREKRLSATDVRSTGKALDQRWSQLAIVELDDTLVREAASLADAHPLRASDAVHLASALSIAGEDPAMVTFACWDARLWDEAHGAGFIMGPVIRPGSDLSIESEI